MKCRYCENEVSDNQIVCKECARKILIEQLKKLKQIEFENKPEYLKGR